LPAVLKPPPPRPKHTPENLPLSWQPARPTPIDQADLCIDVPRPSGKGRSHRLVILGDSLSHGFKNYAISDTEHSWPAIVAYELGWLNQFRRPLYDGPEGCEGLPLNLYALLHDLEGRRCPDPDAKRRWKLKPPFYLNPLLLSRLVWNLKRVKQYWESGPGSKLPDPDQIPHNLAIYGWDLWDSLRKDFNWCQLRIAKPPKGNKLLNLLFPMVAHPNERAALRVLHGDGKASYTQVSAAQALAKDGGIETLVVALGANNALRSIVNMDVVWSENEGFRDPEKKDWYTVWRPEHFRAELRELVAEVEKMDARHVVWWSVPHVTIAPLAHGVGDKPFFSRYFTRYTYVFTPDDKFDGNYEPSLSADQARVVDAAIDGYNRMIKTVVRKARRAKKDWYYFDFCGLLDSMAFRRYLENPRDQPRWFVPYQFPTEFSSLSPLPDTRFTTSDHKGRLTGGLIGLDGVHPTTVGYGIVAREMIRVLEKAGMTFYDRDGKVRASPINVDWQRLFDKEPLLSCAPASLAEDLGFVGFVMRHVDHLRSLQS
jgi:hypothetical protein